MRSVFMWHADDISALPKVNTPGHHSKSQNAILIEFGLEIRYIQTHYLISRLRL